jgi:hypothetical protein
MPHDGQNELELSETTRRAVLAAAAGTLGTSAVGVGSAHPESEGDSGDHKKIGEEENIKDTEIAGYHSLGGVGTESVGGTVNEPHYGASTELILHEGRGLAFVGFFSSREPTEDRGLAIIDVSGYLDAESAAEAEDAEMSVVSFLRNDNPAAAVMDVNPSTDGEYVFISKQSVTALFGVRGVGEGTDTNAGQDASPQGDSLQAVDVSDPGNPEVVATWDVWGGLGPHNSNYHRIGGSDYVFACKGATIADSAMYVFEFDRTTETLREVNVYTLSGNLAQGEAGLNSEDGGLPVYSHDVVVQDDPKTGDPVAYWANFGGGARILDVSDPADIQEIGYANGDYVAHYVEPAPTLIDGERYFVIGEEISSGGGGEGDRSGWYLLANADPAFDDESPSTELDDFDRWALVGSGADFENFTLSPHNCDLNSNGLMAAGHYHGGTRFFDISGGAIDEIGHHRGTPENFEQFPEDAEGSVSRATPFHWTSELANGLAFSSGINTGTYVFSNTAGETDTAPEIGRNPTGSVDIDRADVADAYEGSVGTSTVRIRLEVTSDRPVVVRDRIPADFELDGGDDAVTYEAGGARYVEFTEPVDGQETRTAFVRLSGDTGTFDLGPAQYRIESYDGGDGTGETKYDRDAWRGLPGTVDTNVGIDTL